MGRNIIAMYPDLNVAERVVDDLIANGVTRDCISIVSHHATERYRELSTMSDEQRQANAATGAGAGAAGGAVGGVLASIGLAALPGVGWILAAGPVGSIVATGLIGAGVGAVAGGLGGALSKAGVPVDPADRYAEAIRRGGALVAAEVPSHRAEELATVMERHNPLDIDRSARRWREHEGWEAHDPAAEPFDAASVAREREHWRGETRGAARPPVLEEEIRPRQENVDVARPETGGKPDTVVDLEANQRAHASRYFPGRRYVEVRDAYQLGAMLASSQDRDVGFDRIDTMARERWEKSGRSTTYDEIRDAVRYGYEEALSTRV